MPMRQALRSILSWARRRRLVVATCLVLAIGLWLALPRIAAHLFYNSSPPMRHAYRTWLASSHHSVPCSGCHDQPGIAGMLRAVWANTGRSGAERGGQTASSGMEAPPSARCLSCHLSGEMPEEIVYHLMTVTHQEHLDRGAECSDCHANVVHAVDGPFASTPTMESCLVCHDSDEAPDRCCLCHLDLGDGHPPRYVADYPDPHRKYVPLPEDDLCRRCHGDYVHDWTEGHEEAAQEKPESCRACHRDEFCRSCHTEGRPETHTVDFGTSHEEAIRATPDLCQLCHRTGFCLSCHQQNPPQDHQPATFVRSHSTVASTSPGLCRTCHPPTECDSCHRGMRPSDHGSQWIHRHGQSASRRRSRCLECHNTSYCDTCHRIPMPHPKDIQSAHGPIALGRYGRYCSLCHSDDECAACHAESRPASHSAEDWPTQHANSEADSPLCALCHGITGCIDCHGLAIPHPDDWLLKTHGPETTKSPDVCSRCHKPDYCMTCHESVPLKTHEAGDFLATHGAKPEDEPECALCHAREARQDACLFCHRGIPMPHPEGYALDHKAHASYEREGPCLACHELEYCKLCHDDVP